MLQWRMVRLLGRPPAARKKLQSITITFTFLTKLFPLPRILHFFFLSFFRDVSLSVFFFFLLFNLNSFYQMTEKWWFSRKNEEDSVDKLLLHKIIIIVVANSTVTVFCMAGRYYTFHILSIFWRIYGNVKWIIIVLFDCLYTLSSSLLPPLSSVYRNYPKCNWAKQSWWKSWLYINYCIFPCFYATTKQ